MYRGEYKSVAPNGLPYYYAAGDTVLYQGRIYEVVNPTPKSPFQSPKDWKFVGVSEPYQNALSPFEPVENQFWVDANKTLFIRAYTGTGYTWQSLSGSASNVMYARSINIITGSTTASDSARTDYVYQGNSTGNITLTLPSATGNTNRYTIKNSNTGTFRIETSSSQTIDGVTFYEIAKQYQSIDLVSDNSNWFII
jgi:hypothetical protein